MFSQWAEYQLLKNQSMKAEWGNATMVESAETPNQETKAL
jgi:hypothetical protein